MNKKFYSILAAFILSIIIWGSVTLSYYYVIKVRVPIKVTNLPDGYIIGSVSVKDITINLRGEGWKILSLLWGKKPNYVIALSQDEMDETFYLKDALKENEWLSNGIQVFDMYPTSFKYKVEKMKEKKVRIYSALNLIFNPEYGIASKITIIPESITVSGPKAILNELDSIPTLKKQFDNLENNVDEKVELQPIENVTYSTNIVNVIFDVQKIVDKSFENLEVEIVNLPKSREVSLFPNKISVVLRGGINILSKLSNDNIHPFVDYQSLIKDTTGTIEPTINIAGFTKTIDIKPARLTYIIKKF
ncbi:MAG: hypothetical protein NTX22_06430 [Ignavibacteriales bacterium]|nr:hypothetical protein [Ignavibacteriales bacterium]